MRCILLHKLAAFAHRDAFPLMVSRIVSQINDKLPNILVFGQLLEEKLTLNKFSIEP